jgi:Fe-S-cluster-containing dehydrogenase component
MTRRLILDLASCDQCDSCTVGCGGLLSLRERATFELICRRCEQASCIIACPFDALERREDGGVIKRHNLRCVSCKLCAQACPFGTIYTDLLPFYEINCDGCPATEPPCVAACHRGALEFREIDPAEPNVHIINEHFAARAEQWVRREAAEVMA